MNDPVTFDSSVQDALGTEVLRGDNEHFGRLWTSPKSTTVYRIVHVLAAFANSFLFYLLFSFAQSRYWGSILMPQLIVHVILTFLIYGGLHFLFYNTTRNHVSALTSLAAAFLTTLGVHDKDKDGDNEASTLGTSGGAWLKLLLSWIGIIPGAFAGVFATAAFVDPGFISIWNYGAPKIGVLFYLDPSDPLNTPLANASAVGFTLELLAGIIYFFGLYWIDGHKSVARNRVLSSAAIGATAAFSAAIAAPFTGAPVNVLLWVVHAIRTGSLFDAVIYALAPLVAFAIATIVVLAMWAINRFTDMDSYSDNSSVNSKVAARYAKMV